MNIKEAIERGLYPVDSKGRPLVPHKGGGQVVICATDMPRPSPLLGFRQDGGDAAADCGWGYNVDSEFLLLPAPRKVPMKRYAVMISVAENKCHATFARREDAEGERKM